MEPLATAAATVSIASGTSTLLQTGTKGVRSAYRRARLSGTIDQKWLKLSALSGGERMLSAAQVSDIHAFLESDPVKPILSLLALGTVLSEAEDVVEGARTAFLNECKRWNIQGGQKWVKSGDALFASIAALFRGSLPDSSHSPELQDEIEAYSEFLATPLRLKENEGANRAYIGRLLALTGDLGTLQKTAELSVNLADSIRAGEQDPIIGHAEVDSQVSFDDLYVSRDFVGVSTDSIEDSGGLVSSGAPFRVLIMGSPGAGKSTFVKFLTAGLANPQMRNPVLPSVVLKCRDYARDGFTNSLVGYASKQLSAEHLPVKESALEALLLTGKIAVVFDGLDEITDLPRRQDMVKRIHRLTAQFPSASILVTTREVGYVNAPLNAKVFRSVRLQEFSDDQIEEYCTRWFGKNKRDNLVDHFLAESEAVSDLRANPLLLSLLCILYRDSGAIPANRRGIYRECAQLLFHKWDAHRQIRHFEVLPDYMDRLMEEIARWIYNSSAAQAGLEEQIIVKSLSNYMVSDLGFMQSKAESTAKDFLDFCAGRAWLLGVTGTSKYGGQRIFSFTHRTFYEFFAAEAFAREAENAADMATRLREAYEKDSTSLLPELLIQSFDQTRTRGATNVFISLCLGATPPTLLLRLMDGANLAPHAREKGFEIITQGWELASDPEIFTALLQISGPARDHFQSEYLRPGSASLTRRKFLYGWASLQLSGSGTRFNEAWSPVVTEVLETYAEELASLNDAVTMNWLLGSGKEARAASDMWDYFVCYGLYGWVPGVAWWLIDGALNQGMTEAPGEQSGKALERLVRELNEGAKFPWPVIKQLRGSLELVQAQERTWGAPSDSTAFLRTARTLLAYVVLALTEGRTDESELANSLAGRWPELTTILALREAAGRRSRKRSRPGLNASFVLEMPDRFEKWAQGSDDFVDFDPFDDDPVGIKFRNHPPLNWDWNPTFEWKSSVPVRKTPYTRPPRP
ncbi:hypothetical protein GCM10023063_20380 [Arthrobacter methylotrophus]|uniref:NACHT domain-containing protein n=1 Tax=Arthrobacter methylotrophus TaxID=121291 RepID=A0ABV5UXP7_9MICC